MKIRITLLTENNATRPAIMTEELVKAAWQTLFDMIEGDDKVTVESAEFVEEEPPKEEKENADS